MTEPEHETCKSIAEQLGGTYTAMRIGKLRAAVCTEEDWMANTSFLVVY